MHASSADLYDIATLEATYRAQYLENFKCTERLDANIENWIAQGRGYPPQERIDAWTARCKQPMNLRFSKFTYTRCLCNYNNPSFGYYMQLYNSFKLGMPPEDAGIVDQPANLMEVINIIQGLENERQEFEYKKQKTQAQTKSKGRK